MKKRLEKKVEKLRRDSGNGAGDQRHTFQTESAYWEQAHSVFFFSGHTAGVTVSVYNDGWAYNRLSNHRMEAYIDASIKDAELTDLKNGIKNVMEELRYAGKM